MMKLANPLYYPSAVLVAGVSLVAGVRLAKVPSGVMLPVAAAIATVGASIRKSQEPETLNLDNPELASELLMVRRQAKVVAERANELRQEATRLLTQSTQLDVLAAVQFACDRAGELPAKIDELSRRMQGSDSLLSVGDLQKQLAGVEMKLRSSSGLVREQLTKLVESLQRNIQLAREGQDARQAQVASLSTLILDSVSVLQEMQNKLRSSNLIDAQTSLELRSLSDELSIFQENVDLLVSQ
ncbi:MAG: hypothetical protein HC769_05980 [Cyanobacteria bacterium CRU_2_1]|nr:hypothetical protein [Cyanobacteria bacterium RU_5_0]NJR58438.1 hypothetical protein [Cyanobacteria bacterium CRU_2_1]